MKAGFVNIFGKPNAGKSTLLNALLGEKLAIVSSKVQTTRHRIKGILSTPEYQVIFSDTPGIIVPKYRLHEKMMHAVRTALEDADLAIFLIDVNDDLDECDAVFTAIRLKAPAIVLVNKADNATAARVKEAIDYFKDRSYAREVIAISALKQTGTKELLQTILRYLPEGEPFFDDENLTDMPTRFFVGELIREQIYGLFQDEIPYHTTVLVQEFKEKQTLVKISADIIVQRETQKGILLGEKGSMIRTLGTNARQEIEKFIGQKVFLELFVKVRPKWRDNDTFLREYGYH
jgi:GTPase